MIETKDSLIHVPGHRDPLPLYSLYSETRRPTSKQLAGLDSLVFDLQDLGCRVYTYMYTLAESLKAAAESDTCRTVVVLDRPNPLGLCRRSKRGTWAWDRVEGPVLDPSLRSFIGEYPLPLRHGLTMGGSSVTAELGNFFKDHLSLDVDYRVVIAPGLKRSESINSLWSRLQFVLASPNMPSLESVFFYPAFVLIEGTKLSEGRGTTIPFQLIGAPFVDSAVLCQALQAKAAKPRIGSMPHNSMAGVRANRHHFQPTFNKHKGETCNGVRFNIFPENREAPNIFAVGIHFLAAVRRLFGDAFEWLPPGYEYNYESAPIDLLIGSPLFRQLIDRGCSDEELDQALLEAHSAAQRFAHSVQRFHLYS